MDEDIDAESSGFVPEASRDKVKKRSSVLEDICINEEYQNRKFGINFRRELKNKLPFPHWQLQNFINNRDGIVEDIEAELQDYHAWERKANDLYSLYQTGDFKSLDVINYSNLFSFRQFMYTHVRDWLESVSGVSLLPNVDMNGSVYTQTDGLLPHSDQIGTRHFAFVYYLTAFGWKPKRGGYLHLFNSNDLDEPTSVAIQLPPLRNSFVLFEVSHRSWHRVEEVLSSKWPRLSINGWFHSKRIQEPRRPRAEVLPRSIPTQNDDIRPLISETYLNRSRQKQILDEFENSSELSLKDFLQDSFKLSLLCQLESLSSKFIELGPPNKRKVYRLNINSASIHDGSIGSLVRALNSTSAVKLFTELTGCGINDCKCSVSVTKLNAGCYIVAGDEDAEQAEKDGYSLDIHYHVGELGWPIEADGKIVYVGKDEKEELITIAPESNTLSMVLREPTVYSFMKYVNHRANGNFYLITVRYYNVNMEEDEKENKT